MAICNSGEKLLQEGRVYLVANYKCVAKSIAYLARRKRTCKIQRLLTKGHQIFIGRRCFIGCVSVRILVAILPSVVECQRTE